MGLPWFWATAEVSLPDLDLLKGLPCLWCYQRPCWCLLSMLLPQGCSEAWDPCRYISSVLLTDDLVLSSNCAASGGHVNVSGMCSPLRLPTWVGEWYRYSQRQCWCLIWTTHCLKPCWCWRTLLSQPYPSPSLWPHGEHRWKVMALLWHECGRAGSPHGPLIESLWCACTVNPTSNVWVLQNCIYMILQPSADEGDSCL